MKTTGLTIQEAIKAVQEGKAEGIGSEIAPVSFSREFLNNPLAELKLSPGLLIGEWRLFNPTITPSPGEVWRHESGYECYIYTDGQIKWRGRPDSNSTFHDTYDHMIHNQNGWKRVYDPKA